MNMPLLELSTLVCSHELLRMHFVRDRLTISVSHCFDTKPPAFRIVQHVLAVRLICNERVLKFFFVIAKFPITIQSAIAFQMLLKDIPNVIQSILA